MTVDGHRIYLWEEKRHYDAFLDNEFQSVPEGTKVTVRAQIQLKGAARLLSPYCPRSRADRYVTGSWNR